MQCFLQLIIWQNAVQKNFCRVYKSVVLIANIVSALWHNSPRLE